MGPSSTRNRFEDVPHLSPQPPMRGPNTKLGTVGRDLIPGPNARISSGFKLRAVTLQTHMVKRHPKGQFGHEQMAHAHIGTANPKSSNRLGSEPPPAHTAPSWEVGKLDHSSRFDKNIFISGSPTVTQCEGFACSLVHNALPKIF